MMASSALNRLLRAAEGDTDVDLADPGPDPGYVAIGYTAVCHDMGAVAIGRSAVATGRPRLEGTKFSEGELRIEEPPPTDFAPCAFCGREHQSADSMTCYSCGAALRKSVPQSGPCDHQWDHYGHYDPTLNCTVYPCKLCGDERTLTNQELHAVRYAFENSVVVK